MGFVMGLMGAGYEYAASRSAAESAETAGEYNKETKYRQAEYVESKTAADVGAHRRSFDKFRGALRADIAAFGGSSSSGTGLLIAQEAELQAKLDELNIAVDGHNQAATLRRGGDIDEYEGKATAHQRRLGGLGSALRGFGQAATSVVGF